MNKNIKKNEIEKEVDLLKRMAEFINMGEGNEQINKFVKLAFEQGSLSKQKDVLKIIDEFKGEEYTDKEIWDEIKLEIKKDWINKMKRKNKRRVIRISENGYQALLEIQKCYQREIGIKPLLSQLIEKAIADLFKQKLQSQNKEKK